MKTLYIILFSFLITIGINAQEVKVLDFKPNPMDLSASTHPRFDGNNDAGALVKVLLDKPNARFEGNIIGGVEYKNGEYWVYLTENSKFLTIKIPNVKPLQVNFADFKMSTAQSRKTYELALAVNSQASSVQEQKLTITFTPSNAAVLIDNKMYPSNDGKVTAMLPVGKHDVTIAAVGYDSYEATITLRETSPSNMQTTLIKSTNVDISFVSQKDNSATENGNTTMVIPAIGDANSVNSQYVLDKVAEGKRLYDNKDYVDAFKCFQIAAEAGNMEGQNLLGMCYLTGNGVMENSVKAVKWFTKTAEAGNADGQNTLGLCYFMGKGVTVNYGEAAKWYRKAAEQGNANAQCNLGICYFLKKGVSRNFAEAAKWYRKAADQGQADAQYNLGTCYFGGFGVTKDYTEAVKWYRMAAEQGNIHGQYSLAICYEKGKGVVKDKAEAFKWYQKAATQGHVDAKKKIK